MIDTRVLQHFATVDPILHQALNERKATLRTIAPVGGAGTYFARLCEDIISQQLAGKAADAIIKRFVALFPSQVVTAKGVQSIPEKTLRDVGLSWAKVRSIKDLAEHTLAGLLQYERFAHMSDEEVINDLIQVRGIGRWTAEMFLLFTMGREDVFSFGDLGLKKGFEKLYESAEAPILQERMTTITSQWAPYRSYGSLVLWAVLDNR